MFKRYHAEVKMVKNQKETGPAPEPRPRISPERISRLVDEQAKNVVIGTAVLITLVKTLDCLSTIAINAAPKR